MKTKNHSLTKLTFNDLETQDTPDSWDDKWQGRSLKMQARRWKEVRRRERARRLHLKQIHQMKHQQQWMQNNKHAHMAY